MGGRSATSGPAGRHASLLWCLLLVAGVAPAPGFGQESMEALFSPPVRAARGALELSGQYFESASVDDQKERLDFTGSLAQGHYAVPLAAPNDLVVSFRAAHYGIDTDALLPPSAAAIPSELWHLELGGAYRHHFTDRRMAGLALRTYSPSDRPFNTFDETVLDATAIYRVPSSGNNSWAFFLNYGNRRSFLNNIPLPGVAYAYAPSRETFALIGLPVAMFRTRPARDWSVELFYFPPIRGRAQLGYDLHARLNVYTGMRSYRDAFLRAEREDPDNWLRHEVLLGELGFTWAVTDRLALGGAVGYAFNRYLYESDSFGDDGERLDLENGVSYRLALHATL